MKQKPNILEQAFDHLSAFKYLHLRKVISSLWLFATVFSGWIYLMIWVEIIKGNVEIESKFLKDQIIWAAGSSLFAYVLYLWEKRDVERKLSQDIS